VVLVHFPESRRQIRNHRWEKMEGFQLSDQLDQILLELLLIIGNQLVAMKRDESL
jgi:hypothetical protein